MMPLTNCECVTLADSLIGDAALKSASFQFSFLADDAITTLEFHAAYGGTVDVNTKSFSPVYKTPCGKFTLTTLVNGKDDGLQAADRSMKRWMLSAKQCGISSIFMSTDWEPLQVTRVCPHCVFSCPCISGAKTLWMSSSGKHTVGISHGGDNGDATEEHALFAIASRWAFIQAVEEKVIEVAGGSQKRMAKAKAACKEFCGSMEREQVEHFHRASLFSELWGSISSLLQPMTESEAQRVFGKQECINKVPKLKKFFSVKHEFTTEFISSVMAKFANKNTPGIAVLHPFKKDLEAFWYDKKIIIIEDSALALRLNKATQGLKAEAEHLLALTQQISRHACGVKDQGLVQKAVDCLRVATAGLTGCNAACIFEYEGIIKTSKEELVRARECILEAESYRAALLHAKTETARLARLAEEITHPDAVANKLIVKALSCMQSVAAAIVADETPSSAELELANTYIVEAHQHTMARLIEALARLKKAAPLAEEADRLKESQFIATLAKLTAGGKKKKIADAAECLAQAESFRDAALKRAEARYEATRLQARVRTALLQRRIEAMRAAAELLASARYELRTMARFRDDAECSVCFSSFDYHRRMPLTAPCSHMPMCAECCRDYTAICLCGESHFDRRLWRVAL